METRDTAPEGATDPWAGIHATATRMLWNRPESLQEISGAVDRARAAVEAAHQQEIVTLRNEIAALRGLHGIALDQVTTRLRDSRAEIEKLTRERDEAIADRVNLKRETSAALANFARAVNERGEAKAERDALAAHVAKLREALQQALGVLLGPYCEADEDTIVAVEAALAATEGGTHE